MMGSTTAEKTMLAPTTQPSNGMHDAGVAGESQPPAAGDGGGQQEAPQEPPKGPKVVGPNIMGKREEYQLVRRLQSALFGGVYEANGLSSGKEFAIKVLHKSELSKAREVSCIEFCEIPLSEIRFSELMQGDEHVMEVEEYFEDAYCFYVVFELARGGDLLEALKHKPHGFDEKEAQYYIKQAALGLSFLHRRRVAMQDVSLENMLLHVDERTGNFQVKICDPGQAIVFDQGQNGEELPVAFRGLVGKSFRPPELHEQKSYCATKVDSWCLGWSTFYLLTAHPLFMSADPSQKDADWALFRQDPVAHLRQKGNLCSDTGLDFLFKLLQIEPSRRMSIDEALRHAWLAEPNIAPVPAPIELLPESMQRKSADPTNSEASQFAREAVTPAGNSISGSALYGTQAVYQKPGGGLSGVTIGNAGSINTGSWGPAGRNTLSRTAFEGGNGEQLQSSRPSLASGRGVTYVVATNHSPAPQQRISAMSPSPPQNPNPSPTRAPYRVVPSRHASPVPGTAQAGLGGRLSRPSAQQLSHNTPQASPLPQRPSMVDAALKAAPNTFQPSPRQPVRTSPGPSPRHPSRDPVRKTENMGTGSVNTSYVAPPISGLAKKAAAAVPDTVSASEVNSLGDERKQPNSWAFRTDSFQMADGPRLVGGPGGKDPTAMVSPGRGGSVSGAPSAAAVPAPSRLAFIGVPGQHLIPDAQNRSRQTPLRGQGGNTIYLPRSPSPVQKPMNSPVPSQQEQQGGSKLVPGGASGNVPPIAGIGSASVQPGTYRVLSPSPTSAMYRAVSPGPGGACGSPGGGSPCVGVGPAIPIGEPAVGFSWSQAPSAAFSPRPGSPFEARAVSPTMFVRGHHGITWSPGPPSPRVPSRPTSPAPMPGQVQFVVPRPVPTMRTSVSPGPGPHA